MKNADKIEISVSPNTMRALHEVMAAGNFGSADDALGDALREWQAQRNGEVEQLSLIRNRIRRSLDDPRSDVTIEEVDAHLDALFAAPKPAGDRAGR